MCGRYTLTNPSPLQIRFGLEEFAETRVVPRFNIAPTQHVPIVVETDRGRALRMARWGFRPAWAKDAPRRPPPINARAETLVERTMFRGALARQRCLIPADGFYEWRMVPGSRAKQPMHLRLRGGELFAFAGLYTGDPEAPDDELTCAIVTTGANELVAEVHDRMPVILAPEDEAAWLDPSLTDPLIAIACLKAIPAEQMEAYPVSPLVNEVRNDVPSLVERSDPG